MADVTFTHKPEIVLHTNRCHKCGRYYAVEQHPQSSCPYCASARAVENEDEKQALMRVVRSMKGAITRMKRKK